MPPPVFPPLRAPWRAPAAGAAGHGRRRRAPRGAAAMETYRKDPHGVWRSMKVPKGYVRHGARPLPGWPCAARRCA